MAIEGSHYTGPLQSRRAGVLLHPTSLPGGRENGELGADAYRFVDFLVAAGQTVWQILPLGPTHEDRSPYQSLSAYAGNPALISIELLYDWGWLPAEGGVEEEEKGAAVERARAHFHDHASEQVRHDYASFLEQNHHWLEEYVLFRVLKQHHQQGWFDWPIPLRDRDPAALGQARLEHAEALELLRFEQFIFSSQWQALKQYANGRGVEIFGDVPIFVAYDSADVWAHREVFLLDDEGRPTVVAGVPPDYFSETGQRWGNPHYDWEALGRDGFGWWLERMRYQLRLFDLIRIDHFRGFEACWAIPAEEETAINGEWIKVPGEALFERLHQEFDPLPIIAEDLGIITEAVEALRHRFGLPGMKILQFAFGGDAANPYLPHNHVPNSVVYTGTHDNNTTLGWFGALSEQERGAVTDYLGGTSPEMPWALIRAAYTSVARLAVVPMQDLLGLGGEQRMNVPGTTEGNWRWRFGWGEVGEGLAPRLAALCELFGR